MDTYEGASVVHTQQFTPDWCGKLFRRADVLKKMIELEAKGKLRYHPILSRELCDLREQFANKLIITFFFEESTRTRTSFEAAAHKWRMRVISTANAQFSSVAKGESLSHTVKMLSGYYPDAIVMRFKNTGEAEQAARISSAPIINAGDGRGQHPTQALLDLYTIEREVGRLTDLTIVMVGDLANGRTIHSLAYLLAKYSRLRIIFVAPQQLRIAENIKEYLGDKRVQFEELDSLQDAMRQADVVYATRIQKERFGGDMDKFNRVKGLYVIGNEQMSWLKPEAVLMHPLPINSEDPEILPEVENHPQQRYILQAQNGLWVRMALLECVVTGDCFKQ